MPPKLEPYTAWLRGINVGGKNKLPMKQLVTLFTDAGCTDVRTYIQSGNVVLRASPTVARTLATTIEASITKAYGFASPVILRSATALRKAADDNPFLARGIPEEHVHIALLRDAPKPKQIAALDPERSPGDAFEVVGDHLYLHLPNGVGRSKLTNAYFDRALTTISTIRNWRTVLAMLELAESG